MDQALIKRSLVAGTVIYVIITIVLIPDYSKISFSTHSFEKEFLSSLSIYPTNDQVDQCRKSARQKREENGNSDYGWLSIFPRDIENIESFACRAPSISRTPSELELLKFQIIDLIFWPFDIVLSCFKRLNWKDYFIVFGIPALVWLAGWLVLRNRVK